MLFRSGVLCTADAEPVRRITKADLYEDGLSGVGDAASRRRTLLKKLGLPQRLSANALIDVLNALCSYEQYRAVVDQLNTQ